MVAQNITAKVVAPLATKVVASLAARHGLLPTPPMPDDLPRVPPAADVTFGAAHGDIELLPILERGGQVDALLFCIREEAARQQDNIINAAALRQSIDSRRCHSP